MLPLQCQALTVGVLCLCVWVKVVVVVFIGFLSTHVPNLSVSLTFLLPTGPFLII
jgi:hypothetical protein